MQSYDYRPKPGLMAFAILFFGACAVYGFSAASSNHRAMLIDHIIYLAPDQATVFRWVLAVFSVIGAAWGCWGLVQAIVSDQRLYIGEEAIEMPKSPLHPTPVTLAYRDMTAVILTTVRSQRFLTVKTARRQATILESRLDHEAFDTVARLIAEGRERALKAPLRPSGPTPTTRPAPVQSQAPVRPANPNAPRAFGRRT